MKLLDKMNCEGKRAILVRVALACAMPLVSCGGAGEKKAGEARLNALVAARLGDMMKGDYKEVFLRLKNRGAFVRTDIFGEEHVFDHAGRAVSYIASVNGATLDVMDSLALSVEAAAAAQPADGNLQKIDSLVRRYTALCRAPGAEGDSLLVRCEEASAGIAKAAAEGGMPDEERLQARLAAAAGAIMQKEMKAARLAMKREGEAALRFKKEGEAFLAENAKRKGVISLPGGLQYRVIKNGAGRRPADGSLVTVEYEGRFTDGKVFESSVRSNGGKPVTLSMGSVMRGWNEALKLMRAGSEWEIYVPYELGYGEEGADGVPPCAALVFRLKLTGVK